MFYIREILLRIIYILCLFCLLIVIFYNYKHLLVIFVTIPLTSLNENEINHLIYTNPIEILNFYFILIFGFSFFFLLPFIVWQILDFLRPSLTLFEYYLYRNKFILIILFFILLNFLSIYIFIPYAWDFYNDFNDTSKTIRTLNIYLELRVEDYFKFLSEYLLLVNTLFFFITFLITTLLYCGLEYTFICRKIIIFSNILFATLLSPPDIYTQIFILIFLQLIFEITILYSIIRLVFDKHKYFHFLQKKI